MNFIKKETPTQVFSYEFCEILKNTFLTEHFQTTASDTSSAASSVLERNHQNSTKSNQTISFLAEFQQHAELNENVNEINK